MKKHFLLFLFCGSLSAATLKIPDFSPKNIEGIQNYLKVHPGDLTIKIEGPKTIFQTIVGYSEVILGKADSTAGTMNDLGLLKPILKTIVGGTAASYGAGFYLIYRAYKLLRVVGSWTFAASKQNEEEMVLYIRKTQTKKLQKKSLQEIKEEKDTLAQYLKLHTYLCRWKIRRLFLYDRATHRSIVESYQRLCSVESKLCKKEK